MDEQKILEITNELRRMIRKLDESDAERNIAAAIVYLDCARQNIMASNLGTGASYVVEPQVVKSYA